MNLVDGKDGVKGNLMNELMNELVATSVICRVKSDVKMMTIDTN
jgi:hypothetical protein